MKKRGGTLLLAGNSVPSMGSGGVPSQENVGPLRWILRRYDSKVKYSFGVLALFPPRNKLLY